MCITTIANLMQNSIKEGSSRQYFSRDREIVPYIDSHWEYMTSLPRRVTTSWHATIHKTLLKERGLIFVCQEPVSDSLTSDGMYGLLSLELVNIRPNYEAMVRAGHLKPTEGAGELNTWILWIIQYLSSVEISIAAGIRGRGYKRRAPDQFGGSQRKTRNDTTAPKLPAHGYPLDHPFNKDGYRYILAEPDPHAPFRQEFDESSDWAGKPIPGWLYRKLNPSQVLLALHDRAPQLKVAEDRLAITGEKGYCTARATHCKEFDSIFWFDFLRHYQFHWCRRESRLLVLGMHHRRDARKLGHPNWFRSGLRKFASSSGIRQIWLFLEIQVTTRVPLKENVSLHFFSNSKKERNRVSRVQWETLFAVLRGGRRPGYVDWTRRCSWCQLHSTHVQGQGNCIFYFSLKFC